MHAGNYTRARALLERARTKNPKTAELWLDSVRVERAAGNKQAANSVMAQAMQVRGVAEREKIQIDIELGIDAACHAVHFAYHRLSSLVRTCQRQAFYGQRPFLCSRARSARPRAWTA